MYSTKISNKKRKEEKKRPCRLTSVGGPWRVIAMYLRNGNAEKFFIYIHRAEVYANAKYPEQNREKINKYCGSWDMWMATEWNWLSFFLFFFALQKFVLIIIQLTSIHLLALLLFVHFCLRVFIRSDNQHRANHKRNQLDHGFRCVRACAPVSYVV